MLRHANSKATEGQQVNNRQNHWISICSHYTGCIKSNGFNLSVLLNEVSQRWSSLELHMPSLHCDLQACALWSINHIVGCFFICRIKPLVTTHCWLIGHILAPHRIPAHSYYLFAKCYKTDKKLFHTSNPWFSSQCLLIVMMCQIKDID